MPPIRVGLIGLSGAHPSVYEGTSWAANAHLPFLRRSQHFEIVALLNTTVESARNAIQRYRLPESTKAYGNPQDLADDPSIDLVVCSTRVDRHLQPVRPSLIAGKSVYVEWPLEKNVEVAREMAALANAHNAKTMVGLQASYAPVIRKMKSLVEQGAIGRVLSSDFNVAVGSDLFTEGKNIRYFLDRSVGGGTINVHTGHTLEGIIAVLGAFNTFDSGTAISRPTLDIVDYSTGRVIQKAVTNESPDQILMFGTVGPSNALVTVRMQCGEQFPGLPRLDWRIQGDQGSLRVTASALFLGMGAPDIKLQLYQAETGEVRSVPFSGDELDALPLVSQNIGRIYEAFRKGDWVPSFDWAVQRHEQIDKIWRQFDERQ